MIGIDSYRDHTLRKGGWLVVVSNLCQSESSHLRQYLWLMFISMSGTMAKLFLKWPITKLVYPHINPWILYKAIWLYIYIHTCTIWCRRSWPAPSSPRFGSRRRTYCEDSGLSASELTLFSCGRTSQMRSSLSSISIAAFWSISRVGCPSLSMKHPMSTLWCSDPWLEPDWLRTEEFLSPHKDHTWTKAPNIY